MNNKLLLSGFVFALIGVVSVLIENTFYQYIDEDGLLHESLFMPLGVVFLAIGLLLIFVFSVLKLARLVRRKTHEK